jgi:hypothetical protein
MEPVHFVTLRVLVFKIFKCNRSVKLIEVGLLFGACSLIHCPGMVSQTAR